MKKLNLKHKYLIRLALAVLVSTAYFLVSEGDGLFRIASAGQSFSSPTNLFSEGLDSLAISPDGNSLANIDINGQITIRDIASGLVRTEFPSQFDSPVARIVFSPDSKSLATISENSIRLLDAVSGDTRMIRPMNAFADNPVFSPDGRILAFTNENDLITLWNTKSGSATQISTGHQDGVKEIVFSPSSKLMATNGQNDSQIKIWDMSTGKGKLSVTRDTSSPVTEFVFSPDNKTLAIADQTDRITLWNFQIDETTQILTGNPSGINAVAFNSDGTVLATGSQNAQVNLWEMDSGSLQANLSKKNVTTITHLAFSPDGKSLAGLGESKSIYLWDIPKHQVQSLTGHNDRVIKAVFSSNNKTLASLDKSGQVIVWNIKSGLELLTFQTPSVNGPINLTDPVLGNTGIDSTTSSFAGATQPNSNDQAVQKTTAIQSNQKSKKQKKSNHDWKGVTALAISPDGKFYSGANKEGYAWMSDVNGKNIFSISRHHGSAVTGVAFSSDGKRLVTVGRDTELQTWDAANGKMRKTLLAHEHPIRAVAASPDGKFFASAGEETRIMLWDAQAEKLIRILSGGHTDFVNAINFSTDGKYLASAGADGLVLLWDVAKGQLLRTLSGHAGEVNTVSFSKDNKLLASGSTDSMVILWNVATGQQLQSFAGHQSAVRTITFSPNGQRLVSTGEDSKILVWNMTSRKLEKQISGATNAINAIAFDPLGNMVSGSEDGGVTEWDIEKGQKKRNINISIQPQSNNSEVGAFVSPLVTTDLSAGINQIAQASSSAFAKIDPADVFIKVLDWLIPSAEAALPDPNQGPGGPILVVTSTSDPFGKYYAEILRTEGLNIFTVADITTVNATTLASYDVVILAKMALSAAQVTMLSDWVTAGGNLIAMRPDPQLAGLLGITATGAVLSNGYLLVDTSQAPGNGVVNQTMQFHGVADRYTVTGALNVATLYTNATTSTSNPAVTLRSVGSNGGQAAAFTYDLASSIVYTRQGNPVWATQERDGFAPIRSDDKFYGDASGDPQLDWVDFNKIAIPQADEQQRLLANLILQMNIDKKPLPRFWYFPKNKKAVVIMTGDDHGNNGTQGRFDQFIANSPPGCSVADWECIRGTSYIFPNTPLTNAQAASYESQGFEVGLHINTNCGDFTPASLRDFYNQQIGDFTTNFPGITAPITQRHHCIAWSDWVTGAIVQLENGIRFDTSYYFWPPSWVQNRPGFFSGSGMPMRFVNLNGSMIDVYHAASQMTDESGQTYPFTINTLLDRALGSDGFYGAFVINAHTDVATIPESDAVITSAPARGIPIVSSKQMMNWLDGRNSSSFDSLNWSGNTLTFNVTAGSSANNLRGMLPASSAVGVLLSITYTPSGGSPTPVSFTIDSIKGMSYGFFPALTGAYSASFGADITPPTVTANSPSVGATDVPLNPTVTATFSKAMDAATINSSTFELRDTANTLIPATVSYNADTLTATLTPSSSLSATTTYSATVKGGATDPRVKDLAGNALAANVTWSFTTQAQPCTTSTCSSWSDSTVPGTPSVNDPGSVELGVKFRTDIDGFITGIRFYKGSTNTGTHTGTLWTSNGTQLATATFTNETASGWQQVNFSSPVQVSANTVYVASYHAPNGNYAADSNYFASTGVNNGPIHLLQNGVSGGNGIYAYSATSTFPSNSFQSSNYWVDIAFTTSGNTGPDTTPPTVIAQSPTPNSTGIAITTTITTSFNEAMDSASITSSTFELRDAANAIVPATVSYDGNNRTATLSPSSPLTSNATYTATVKGGANEPRVKDIAGNALASTLTWEFTTIGTQSCITTTCSSWSDSTIPGTSSVNDPNSVELGVKFRTDVDGSITGIRFYKGSTNTGTHVGTLWTSTGTQLATATFTNETASGWQQVNFSAPVQINANTVYVASYHAPNGNYAWDVNYFASAGVNNGPIHLLQNGVSGSNGVYLYNANSAFPTNSFQSSNYWVDVVFTTVTGPDTTPPTVTAQNPAPSSTNVATNTTITTTFSEAMDSASITTSTFELRDAANALVPATVSYDGNNRTATLTPSSPLTSDAVYTATIKGGSTEPLVKDIAGNAMAANVSWNFTTAPVGTQTCSNTTSIWPTNPTPSIITDSDTSSVDLGVKFRSSINGSVCGIRFYKGSSNTGVHVGTLWTSSGQQLAQATFTNETASGWQQVLFNSPVSITANTVYVASYHAPAGRYSVNENYFTAAITNGPLYALSNSESGGNGVYLYGSGGFPINTYLSSNYWVDVLFTTDTGPDTTPPTISSTSPTTGATGVNPANPVTVVFSEPMQAATIEGTPSLPSQGFELRNALNNLVPATVTYNASNNSATLSPSTVLATNAPYTAKVISGTSGVKDTAGNALAADFSWGFTTGVNPCANGGNPIVCENAKTGNPASEWDITGAGDLSIQGYATDISVNRGQTARFKIDTPSTNYRLDIYRLGYYNGTGARKVATVEPTATLPQTQPNCLNHTATGLIDCGNWSESASWIVPPDAVSGIYFAKVIREDGANTGSSHIVFIVRDDASTSDLLFQTSDTTWQAYNNYGGNSLYTGLPAGRAYKVSYNRPFNTRNVDNGQDWLFNAEYPMVRWLEANGYNVSYFTGIDAARFGNLIQNHKVFLSVGHDEYWSKQQRQNVETARDKINNPVNLVFLSGNEVFWKVRWENNITNANGNLGADVYRTMVCYKETHASAKIDPSSEWTGTWRDPRFSPPADGGQPENSLTGTLFTVNDGATTAINVPAADGKMRFWRNTSAANLAPNATLTLPNGTLGYEWDEDIDNGFRPSGLIDISTTIVPGAPVLQDYGSTYSSGTAIHSLTLYRAESGALVFGAGTVQWTWGLDNIHDRSGTPANDSMKQATVNLFADMGMQPSTLQPGLTAAAASNDSTAPTSTITSPVNNSSVALGSNVVISGTANDAGGGVVGGVEVSVDGGLTWHPANGRSSWTYNWTAPNVSTAVNIKSRAVDDSLNLETAGAGINVTVGSGSDTTPPTVSMTAPANGATVSGTSVAVSATANDNVGVTSVQFLLDGAPIGTPDTAAPYSIVWNSTGTANGAHTLSARASDAVGNITTAAGISVTVSNTVITNTGLLNPTANAAVTNTLIPFIVNGDGNGFQTSPTNGYSDNGLFAVDTNSGSNTSTSCTNSGKDKHIYSDYSINLPGAATINGIEVRLDARADSTAGAPRMCAQLSWDGGTSWTAAKTTATLTTTEATYTLGGAADTWGRSWTVTNFSNTNFRVRVINVSSSTSRDFSLDWIAVQVTYQ